MGYRFLKFKQKSIVLKLGYSHLVKYYFNYDIKLIKSLKRPTKFMFFSPNKQFLSQLVTTLKLLRVPDNYKGKGLQLFNEMVHIKKREKFGVF